MQHTILFLQVLNNIVLLFVHPASRGNQQQAKSIQAFSGHTAAPSLIEVKTAYKRNAKGLTGNGQVHLRNTAQEAVSVTIADQVHGRDPVHKKLTFSESTAVVLPLHSTHGWYDFTVRANRSDSVARYTGRVETGRPSISDPVLGWMEGTA